jgi:hypothetical protein
VDEPADREVDVVPLTVSVKLGHPQVGQRTINSPPQLLEEGADMSPNGLRIAAERRPVCQGAQAVESVGGAVSTYLTSRTFGCLGR